MPDRPSFAARAPLAALRGMAVALSGLLAAFSLILSALVGASQADARFDQLGALAYPALLAGGFSLLCALGLRAPALILCLAGIGFALPAVVTAPDIGGRLADAFSAGAHAGDLKVLSANLWTSNSDHAPFVALVRRERPDIIVVQEGFGAWKPVLDSLAPDYRIQAGCLYGHDCNVAVLSRFERVQLLEAPSAAMVSVRLKLPARLGAGSVDVLGVHLDRSDRMEGQNEVAARAAAAAAKFSRLGIAAGDFNATPWSRSLRAFDQHAGLIRATHALATWPTPARAFTSWRLRAPLAGFAIDHVYAGCGWRSTSVRRGPDIGSDHYPVIATFAVADDARGCGDKTP